MEIIVNNTLYESCFESYKKVFGDLEELAEAEFPKDIRQFDIRFCLAFGLKIGFDSSANYIKNENERKIYSLIIRQNEMFFAYEGLYNICKNQGILRSNPSKSDPFTQDAIETLGLLQIVCNFNNYVNAVFYSSQRLLTDLSDFLEYLKDNAFSKDLTLKLGRFNSKLLSRSNLDFNEIFALIYAMRNQYVHNAASAKSGVTLYKTKIDILKNSSDFLTLTNLIVGKHIIDLKIEEVE